MQVVYLSTVGYTMLKNYAGNFISYGCPVNQKFNAYKITG